MVPNLLVSLSATPFPGVDCMARLGVVDLLGPPSFCVTERLGLGPAAIGQMGRLDEEGRRHDVVSVARWPEQHVWKEARSGIPDLSK